MTAVPVVGTLAECPRCGGCCYAVMASAYDGRLQLRPHGPGSRCYGPPSAELIDLLLTQFRLRVTGPGTSGVTSV